METLKTALVVVLLLAVLYGVYTVLNKPDANQLPEVAWQNAGVSAPDVVMPPGSVPGAASPLPPSPIPELAPPPASSGVPALELIDDPPAAKSGGGAARLSMTDAPGAAATSPAAAPAIEPPPAARPVAQAGSDSSNQKASAIEPAAPTLAVPGQPALADLPPVRADSQMPSAYADASKSAAIGRDGPQPARGFDRAWSTALGQLEKEQWAEALLTLSLFYNHSELTGPERTQLIDLLDPLAGRVIYSTEHTLEAPYQVRAGETLDQIAAQFQVPTALLQNINGIGDPRNLPPGTALKVVRGPFRAEVNLAQSELVLFLGRYYAGRFSLSVGNDPTPQPAEYQVLAKAEGREYFAPDGSRVAPHAPDNPYGRYWIDLGQDICIHGSPDSLPAHGGLGCLSLSDADVADVYGILGEGSKVLIR